MHSAQEGKKFDYSVNDIDVEKQDQWMDKEKSKLSETSSETFRRTFDERFNSYNSLSSIKQSFCEITSLDDLKHFLRDLSAMIKREIDAKASGVWCLESTGEVLGQIPEDVLLEVILRFTMRQNFACLSENLGPNALRIIERFLRQRLSRFLDKDRTLGTGEEETEQGCDVISTSSHEITSSSDVTLPEYDPQTSSDVTSTRISTNNTSKISTNRRKRRRREITVDRVELDPVVDDRCQLPDSTEEDCSEALVLGQIVESPSSCYWWHSRLPSPDVLFLEHHWKKIGHVTTCYQAYKNAITHLQRARSRQTWLKVHKEADGEEEKEAGESLPGDKDRSAYTGAFLSYCVRFPEFNALNSDDQLTIRHHGQSSNVVLVAAMHWSVSESDHLAHHMDGPWRIFCDRLASVADQMKRFNLDLIETSLISLLLIIATDIPHLKEPELIEIYRYDILTTFQAFETAKYGSSNDRIRDLFRYVSTIRELGELHNRLTKTSWMPLWRLWPIENLSENIARKGFPRNITKTIQKRKRTPL